MAGDYSYDVPQWLQPEKPSVLGQRDVENTLNWANFFAHKAVQQQGIDQNNILFPLKVQQAKNQIADSALDYQMKQLQTENMLQQKQATVEAANFLGEASRSEGGLSDLNKQAQFFELAAKNPSLTGNPVWLQGLNMIRASQTAREKADEIKLRTQGLKDVATIRSEALTADEKKIKASEHLNSLADDLEANGDDAGAQQYRTQASVLMGSIRPSSSSGSDPAAIKNAKALSDAEKSLADAEKSGDTDKIKEARSYLNNLRTTAKVPGFTAADQRVALSSRTLPERALSNATMAHDQVSELINTLSPGSIGPMGVFNSMYQKTVGNIVPTKAGERAIDQRTQLMQLRSSLEGMAGKDKARTGMLMKQISEMMPDMGVLESPAAAATSLKRIRDWVTDYARRASGDLGILPPPWAMTEEDAVKSIAEGDSAIASGNTPESNPRWGEKYMTRKQFFNWKNSLQVPIPAAQPPTNAPVQLPTPP